MSNDLIGYETSQHFEEDIPVNSNKKDLLLLTLDGYEGPIDLLLGLARDHKIDLTSISILDLANQYLNFINQAQTLKLEIAADYLVMAAWLAYLKSRLLLPAKDSDEDGEDPAELAARLAFQLQRLQAMQNISQELMDRPRLGIDFFARGMPEMMTVNKQSTFDVSLYELLQAYGNMQDKIATSILRIMPTQLYSMDDALERLRKFVDSDVDWQTLEKFLPENLTDPLVKRSALAATFAASLELTREGLLEIRQGGTYAPIYLKKSNRAQEEADNKADGSSNWQEEK